MEAPCIVLATNFLAFLQEHLVNMPDDPLDNLKKCQRIIHLFTELHCRPTGTLSDADFQYFYKMFINMSYQPPWDNEKPIDDTLHDLCRYLSEHFPNDEALRRTCNEPLTEETFQKDVAIYVGLPGQACQQH